MGFLMMVLVDCRVATHINVIPACLGKAALTASKITVRRDDGAGLERQLWKRVAISFVAVSLFLLMGKFLPVPGISGEIVVETMKICQPGHGGFIGFPMIYVCHGPMLPHKELL